ncbi:MAG: uracil-DNA glycosylase [Magnetococcales bacterium]|nr:uracil-DNA glycosylase [Magnetococcales bacterium]
MDISGSDSSQPIDCMRCRHFQITWEAGHPRACRAMGFKTALWPWQEVLRSSGGPCLKFESKSPPPKNTRNPDGSETVHPSAGGFSRRA